MKMIYFFIVMFLIAVSPLSAQTWQWTHPEPNGPGIAVNESDAAHDVETDAAGNVYVLGEYYNSLYLSNTLIISGTVGSYLAKYNPYGVLQWYKLFYHISGDPGGGYPYIRATDFTINADGIFITGKYTSNNYSFYDCNNNIGYGTPLVYHMADEAVESNYNENGFFLTKMDFNGNKVWNKLATVPPGTCSIYGPYYFYKSSVSYSPIVTTDENNNIIASFLWQGTSSSFYVGTDLITLDANLTYPANYILTLKYNSNGNLQWQNFAKNSNGIGSLYDLNSIATDNSGNIFLYGSSYSGSIFGSFVYQSSTTGASTFIAKLSAGGTWQLVKELCNNSANNVPTSTGLGNPELLTTDDQGNVYALANGMNSSFLLLGTYNFWPNNQMLVKLNNNAELIWYKSVANYPSRLLSIKYANQSLYLTGGVSVDLSSSTIPIFAPLNGQAALKNTSGHTEYFVAKADTSGNFTWVNNFSSSSAGYLVGMGIGVVNDNIYTAGKYGINIGTLGNLNSQYQATDFYASQIFLGKLKDQYIRIGAISAKQVMPGCNISIPFTSTGLTFSAKNKFTAELSNASGDFTTPTIIGSIKSTGTGSINAIVPTTLAVGTSGYKIRIRSTDTLLTGFNYFAYADTGYTLTIACPGVASGQTTTNITGTTATLNWAAVGCAAGYKIQYRVKGTTAWTTQNTTGNITSLALTGLTINTIYQWRMATKCKNGTATSFSAYSPIQQFKTAAAIIASAENALEVRANEKKIWVQPNPAVNNSTVIFTASQANTKYTIQLTDLSGKIIWHKEGITVKGNNTVSVNLSKFAKSIYLVHVLINGEKDQSAMLYKN